MIYCFFGVLILLLFFLGVFFDKWFFFYFYYYFLKNVFVIEWDNIYFIRMSLIKSCSKLMIKFILMIFLFKVYFIV